MATGRVTHADEVLREAMSYVSMGWQVVPCHGVLPDGRCTCGSAHAGSAKRTIGKHPLLSEWQKKPVDTEEDCYEIVDRLPMGNIGVLLGPGSGVIDIEYDDELGKATAERLGLSGLATPTYRSGESGRSIHRLFAWTDRLPKSASRKIEGLEVRIGGDGRGSQSILPPSRHWAGGRYEWLHGLSPSEVSPLPVPESVMMLLAGGSREDIFGHGESLARRDDEIHGRSIIERTSIGEGERNDALFRGACRLARQWAGLDRAEIQADFVEWLRAMNAWKMSPPLEIEEVDRIAAGAIHYATRTPGTAATAPGRDMTRLDEGAVVVAAEAAERARGDSGKIPQTWLDHGLTMEGGVYGPGNWSLTVVDSDPPIYRIHVPAWIEWTPDRTGDVCVDHETYQSPARMASAVMAATRVIYLAGPDWKAIWTGAKKQPSLLRQLLLNCTRLPAPIEMQVWATPAEYLLRQIDAAPIGEVPDETGAPVWVDDVCWLAWGSVFDLPIQQGRFPASKVQELFGKLGMMRRARRIWPEAGNQRRRYSGFSRECVDRLRGLILGE